MPFGNMARIRPQGGVGQKRGRVPQVRLSRHIASRASKTPPKLLVLHKVGSTAIHLEASAPGWALSIAGIYSSGGRSLISGFEALVRNQTLARR